VGFGVDAGAIGGLFKGTKQGTGAENKAYLEGVLANAQAAGMDKARIPELLAAIAGSNARMESRGLNVDQNARMGMERAARGLGAAGFNPIQGRNIMEGAGGVGQQLSSSLSEMMMPAQARQGLMLQWAFKKGGGWSEAMKRAQGLEQGKDPAALQEMLSNMGLDQQTAGMMGFTGLGYGAAGKLGRYRAAGGSYVAGAEGTLERGAEGVMGTEEGQIVATSAATDAMQTFAAGLADLGKMISKQAELTEKSIDNMGRLWEKLMGQLDENLTGANVAASESYRGALPAASHAWRR
jgi:hypothetical protein